MKKSPEFDDASAGIWLFGYGSLLWKQGFSFVEAREVYLKNYKRRFWQVSEDHRGNEQQPGRVATVIPDQKSECWGRAFLIEESEWNRVKAALAKREQAGYIMKQVATRTKESGSELLCWTYYGTQSSRYFTGPETMADTARVIAEAKGDSGANVEYLQMLYQQLQIHQERDDYIAELCILTSKVLNR